MGESGGNTGGRRTKVERVVDEYELEDLKDELARRWTAESGERQSLRELADFFNKRVIERALERAGIETLDGNVANIYRLLTDDDVSAGQRTETRSRLERQGLDVSSLEADFVSHQAIHTYLTDRRNLLLPSRSDEERLENSLETLRKLRGRLESVATNDLDRLAETGALDVGDISVLLSLDVVCNDCGERYDIEALLDAGGCGCHDEG